MRVWNKALCDPLLVFGIPEIKCDELYYGDNAESRQKLAKIAQMEEAAKRVGLSLQAIAPTKSLLRLLVLVERCVEQKEPVLLVGGKFIGMTYSKL